jgi:hypothetical protein
MAVAYERSVGLWFTAGAVNAGGSQAGTQDGVLTRPILNFSNPCISPGLEKFYPFWLASLAGLHASHLVPEFTIQPHVGRGLRAQQFLLSGAFGVLQC